MPTAEGAMAASGCHFGLNCVLRLRSGCSTRGLPQICKELSEPLQGGRCQDELQSRGCLDAEILWSGLGSYE